MGACYSKTSHDLANSPRHRTPHEKVVHRNGVATSVAYTPVNKEDVDTRNQNEAPRVTRASWARNSVSRQKKDSEKSDVCRTKSCDTTMGVVPSDSGIESLSPQEETSNIRDCKPQDSSHMHNGGCLAATACGGGKGSDEDEDIWILLTTESNSSDIICKPPSCPQRKAGQPVGNESNGDRLPQENGIPECTTVDGDDCLHASGSTALHQQPKFESTRSSLDMDSICVHIPVLHSLASSPQDTGTFDSECSLELSSAFYTRPDLDVSTTVIDGREVVLIDADTYGQILDELSFLKMKLSQLTSVIEENPDLVACNPDVDDSFENFQGASPECTRPVNNQTSTGS